jgi:hypothetical protein
MSYRPKARPSFDEATETLKARLWHKEPNYIGPQWHHYAVVAVRHRDSDLLERHNFDTASTYLNRFKDRPATDYTQSAYEAEDREELKACLVVRNAHWAVGWIEFLMVDAHDYDATIAGATIVEDRDDYPILDEDGYIEEEDKAIAEAWSDLSDSERERLLYKARFTKEDAQEYSVCPDYHRVLDLSGEDSGILRDYLLDYIR